MKVQEIIVGSSRLLVREEDGAKYVLYHPSLSVAISLGHPQYLAFLEWSVGTLDLKSPFLSSVEFICARLQLK